MPIFDYLSFAARDRRLLGFGFTLAFVSSVGQTFFIGLFGPSIQSELGLSNTSWSTIYMIGTLSSALLFTWTGKLLDRIDLRLYTGLTCLLLIGACALVALVTGPAVLVVSIFLLRHAGQGLASHLAVTSMARYFEAGRGRAIAVASLGFASGEAMLPFLIVLAIASVGWRGTYAGVAVLLGIAFLPVIAWLLAGHPERQRAYLARIDGQAKQPGSEASSWTRRQVLQDRRFLLVLPGALAPPLIITAMFFYHLTLADAKGWSHEWITGSYGIYALAGIVASLATGRLVDHFGAARIFPFMLLPLIGAMLVINFSSSPWSAWPYLFMSGVNSGMLVTSGSALWAELYGAANLGAIRSIVTALSVFASALGPICLGGLMDFGFSIEAICLLFAAYSSVGAVLIVAARLARPARMRDRT